MPVINPSLVPTIAPGNLFSRFTTDTSINIRWYTATDPVYFDVLNRVPADLALRQLIIAKTLDQLNIRLGHQALFPFVIQPKILSGSSTVDIPISLIWDMHVSLPQKWENVRLARVKRISGANDVTGDFDFTGKLRLVFTAQEENSTTEVAVFQADVQLDSDLLYQITRVSIPTSDDETTPIDSGEVETVGGFITFRTLDQDDVLNQAFLDAVAPPVDDTIGSDGFFVSPAIYEVVDNTAGGPTESEDFSLAVIAHGTGLLTVSATNAIPNLDSDIQTFLNTLNYPFDLNATRSSVSPSGVTIPKALFREFDVVAPAGDEPTGDVTGTFYPVWISRVVRDDVGADTLTFYFATYNTSDQPSTVAIEFAKMQLGRNYEAGRIVAVTPVNNLWNITDNAANWHQGFGRGHVVLSSVWGDTSSIVDDFFDLFIPIIDDPAEVTYSKVSTRISSFGISRVPKTVPTLGQSKALRGSRSGVSDPSSTNRYVVEGDQGLGDQVDFATHSSLAPDKRENVDIERYGYAGALAHKVVTLVVNAAGTSHDYNTDILPRLRILLGRDPIPYDGWFDGTRLKIFTSQGVWVG